MSVILDFLLDFVYPKSCAVCGKGGTFLCEECFVCLKMARQTCPMCGRDSMDGFTHPRCRTKLSLDGLTAIYSYRDPGVRKVIEEIKFGFNKELIGILMRDVIMRRSHDCMVPVPLHRLRLNWRGFNQAEEIAKRFGGRTERVLVRKRNTRQQAKLSNLKERRNNVRGAFETDPRIESSEIRGKKILLVDDVFTTGESMKECGRVLKRAGAKEVWGLVLAR